MKTKNKQTLLCHSLKFEGELSGDIYALSVDIKSEGPSNQTLKVCSRIIGFGLILLVHILYKCEDVL